MDFCAVSDEMPEQCDLPRARLQAQGVEALSDRELVAILLEGGDSAEDLFELAEEAVQVMDQSSGSKLYEALANIRGIGEANASKVVASLEFTRRRIFPKGVRISCPEDLVPYLAHYSAKKQEHFLCASLNGANELLAVRCISIGLVDAAHVHPREVFAEVLVERASGVILAHNHPSGSLEPSRADEQVTKQLIESGKLLGIRVLDHLILSERGFSSLRSLGRGGF